MKVIINCDDFGFCEDSVKATVECLDRGFASSATIMANMPATDTAVQYALANPQHSYGVHLTFTTDTLERPLTAPGKIPTITRMGGKFLRPAEVRIRALQGALSVDEIALEMEAQIAVLLQRGLKISHVDSHGHIHKYKPFRLAMAQVLPRYRIARVRTVQDIYVRRPILSPTYWVGPIWRRRLISSAYLSTDHFYMGTSADDAVHSCARMLRPLMDCSGSMEVGIHPGFVEPWRIKELTAARVTGAYLESVRWRLATWNDINAA